MLLRIVSLALFATAIGNAAALAIRERDILDLSDLGVNINILSGVPHVCIPVHHLPTTRPAPRPTHKPTHKPTHRPTTTREHTTKPKPTTTRKVTSKPTTTPRPGPESTTTRQHTPKPTVESPNCPRGYDRVPFGSTGGNLYSSDNDLLDLKDITINVCILDLSGKCGKESGPKTAKSWTCKSPGGCCVKKDTTIVQEDDDLLDVKGLNLNLGLLNL